MMTHRLRIVFAGTSTFSAYQLCALINQSKHKITAILTNIKNINKNKTNKKNHNNDIIKVAKKYNLPIFNPKSLKTPEIIKIISNYNPDIIIVAAYGLKFPNQLLKLPKFGCINIHCSLLPKWRGAAPIQRSLEAGDSKTGVTIIQMNEELDTGNILCQTICDITSNDTNITLSDKLSKIGAKILIKTLDQICHKNYIITTRQNENSATYAKKIEKKEGKIDWKISAKQIERQIRAFNPWPSSYFQISNNLIKIWKAQVTPYKINTKQQIIQSSTTTSPTLPLAGTILSTKTTGIDVATGNGILTITVLQLENRRIMTTQEFLISKKNWFIPGTILT